MVNLLLMIVMVRFGDAANESGCGLGHSLRSRKVLPGYKSQCFVPSTTQSRWDRGAGRYFAAVRAKSCMVELGLLIAKDQSERKLREVSQQAVPGQWLSVARMSDQMRFGQWLRFVVGKSKKTARSPLKGLVLNSMRQSNMPLACGLRAASPSTSHIEENEKLQPCCPDLSANVVQRFCIQALPENTNMCVGLAVWRAFGKRWHGNELHLHATSTIVVAGLGRCVNEYCLSALRIYARNVHKLVVSGLGDSRNAPTNCADDTSILCLLDGKVV